MICVEGGSVILEVEDESVVIGMANEVFGLTNERGRGGDGP
jgi:hypothetical protein